MINFAMAEFTVDSLRAENERLKMIIDCYKRAMEVNRVSCLNYNFEVQVERAKARDCICGQNETIRNLTNKVAVLDSVLASERELFWSVASELENLKYRENVRISNI